MNAILPSVLIACTAVAPNVHASESVPEASAESDRKLALGVTVDVLPIVLSATDGELGLSGQAWLGIEPIRLRLVGASFRQPNWLASQGGFRDLDTTAVALIVDWVFGDHIDEWWVGTGFELWRNDIGHEDGGRERWTNGVWTLGGGYIFRVVGNFYLEPWAAIHVPINHPDVRLAGETYEPLPVMGEVSLKLGWFLEL